MVVNGIWFGVMTPLSGAQGICPTCHTLDTLLHTGPISPTAQWHSQFCFVVDSVLWIYKHHKRDGLQAEESNTFLRHNMEGRKEENGLFHDALKYTVIW